MHQRVLLRGRKGAPRANRWNALADALADALNRTGREMQSTLTECAPSFELRKLSADYGGNGELWESFCWYAAYLGGLNGTGSEYTENSLYVMGSASWSLRTVSVEALASIVVALFWFTLLISHDFFEPAIDLSRWNSLSQRSRRRAFFWLWGFLHQACTFRSDTHPAPARRAAFEIASLLIRDVAHSYEQDREALKQIERRYIKRCAARTRG